MEAAMGLDLYDMTLRIEDKFDVPLSEDDLTMLARNGDILVGDLYDHILRQMNLRDVGRFDIGLNLALWTELQTDIHSVTDVPLKQVELKTPLAKLFPRQDRRAMWQALRDVCPYRIRKLDYPRIVPTLGLILAIAMVLFEQFQLWNLFGLRWFWPVLGLLGIWMLVETYAKVLSILAPLRRCFPRGWVTVKDLCRAVLATNYDDICHDAEIPLDEQSPEVWWQLTEIIAESLGVDIEEVTFRSRLVRDLGMA